MLILGFPSMSETGNELVRYVDLAVEFAIKPQSCTLRKAKGIHMAM